MSGTPFCICTNSPNSVLQLSHKDNLPQIFHALAGRFLGIHKDTKVQKASASSVLFIEPFIINSYVANFPLINKTEVKIIGQFSFRNTINYKWAGELFIRCMEKKASLFHLMSVSFYMAVYTFINSETSHSLFIIRHCADGTEFPHCCSFLRTYNCLRIHPYGLKMSGAFLLFFSEKETMRN